MNSLIQVLIHLSGQSTWKQMFRISELYTQFTGTLYAIHRHYTCILLISNSHRPWYQTVNRIIYSEVDLNSEGVCLVKNLKLYSTCLFWVPVNNMKSYSMYMLVLSPGGFICRWIFKRYRYLLWLVWQKGFIQVLKHHHSELIKYL